MLLLQIYPIIFIFVDFLDFGTHYLLLTFIFLFLHLNQNFRNFYELISQATLMMVTLTHSTTTVLALHTLICHTNQPDHFSN